jgi:hypothetical protein
MPVHLTRAVPSCLSSSRDKDDQKVIFRLWIFVQYNASIIGAASSPEISRLKVQRLSLLRIKLDRGARPPSKLVCHNMCFEGPALEWTTSHLLP